MSSLSPYVSKSSRTLHSDAESEGVTQPRYLKDRCTRIRCPVPSFATPLVPDGISKWRSRVKRRLVVGLWRFRHHDEAAKRGGWALGIDAPRILAQRSRRHARSSTKPGLSHLCLVLALKTDEMGAPICGEILLYIRLITFRTTTVGCGHMTQEVFITKLRKIFLELECCNLRRRNKAGFRFEREFRLSHQPVQTRYLIGEQQM